MVESSNGALITGHTGGSPTSRSDASTMGSGSSDGWPLLAPTPALTPIPNCDWHGGQGDVRSGRMGAGGTGRIGFGSRHGLQISRGSDSRIAEAATGPASSVPALARR